MSDAIPDKDSDGMLRVLRTRSEARAFYDKIAGVYDLLAERSEQPMRELGLGKLAPEPGERILEIGVGTGACLAEITRGVGPSGRAVGIDLSEKMLQQARALLQRQRLPATVWTLQCADAVELPLVSDAFDGVFMSFTLELFDTPEIPRVISECRRVLRSGGRLVVVGISKVGKEGLVRRAFEWTHRHFPNLMDCRPIYVQAAMEAGGLLTEDAAMGSMWVPVEIIRARKT
jgi:demethylmenaquinone methyltransferase/2-methoxy-6-polyprenyl-1,4-benzoquinol methylase